MVMGFALKEMCAGTEGRILSVMAAARKEDDSTRRRRALRRVDMELEKGNFKAALTFVKQLQDRPGGLRGFGSAKLVTEKMKLAYELVVDGVESLSIQSQVDSVLQSIQGSRQLAWEERDEEAEEAKFYNQLQGQGSLENDSCYNSLLSDRAMCLQHEAGHFLVGYLLGVLPKRYKIPTMENLLTDNFAGGKIEFLSFEFLNEVYTSTPSNCNCTKTLQKNKENRHMVSSKTINRFLCVILGGLVAEQLQFGYTELLHSDVEKLDRVLTWLGFNAIEAISKIKLAATNSVLILRQHHEVTSSLAEAMSLGRTIGCCIDTIESNLQVHTLTSLNKFPSLSYLKHTAKLQHMVDQTHVS